MAYEEMYLLPGILIIGALVVAFTFFSLTMLGFCKLTNNNNISSLPTRGVSFDDKLSACMSLESHSITFMYKEAEAAAEGIRNQTECVICLTAFQEEESVRKLHTCKHMFHTPCIDKWLGSHAGCPLCRSQIDQVSSPDGIVANDQVVLEILNSRI